MVDGPYRDVGGLRIRIEGFPKIRYFFVGARTRIVVFGDLH